MVLPRHSPLQRVWGRAFVAPGGGSRAPRCGFSPGRGEWRQAPERPAALSTRGNPPSHPLERSPSVGPLSARVTRSARRRVNVHRQPRPLVRARRGGAPPRPGSGMEWQRERESSRAGGCGSQAGTTRRTGHPGRSALGGTKAVPEGRLRLPQPRRRGGLRLIAKRRSDRRSPGRNPGPQGAFEVSMINVSCNSH